MKIEVEIVWTCLTDGMTRLKLRSAAAKRIKDITPRWAWRVREGSISPRVDVCLAVLSCCSNQETRL